jgi:cytoskeletal protein RodZ
LLGIREQFEKSSDWLYRGKQLKMAQEWAKRNRLSNRKQTFLQASVRRHVQFVLSVILAVLVICSSASVAFWFFLHQPADPRIVTTTNDDGIGSLRWAIKNAPSNSTITFTPALSGQMITLKVSDLHITQHHLTIQGLASGHIKIRALEASLTVDKAASVTLSSIEVQGNKTEERSSLIRNEGTLMLKTCLLMGNNSSIFGDGITNQNTLIMTSTTVSGNAASKGGGGIYNSGTVTMTDSTISGNMTASLGDGRGGGGIFNQSILTVIGSIVSGNTSKVISDPTLILSGGGGISNQDTLTMINSTVSDNTTSGAGIGGGIFNTGIGGIGGANEAPSSITLMFCTIIKNRASARNGFEIANGNRYAHLSLKATIVGGYDAPGLPITGAITSGGYNALQRVASLEFLPKQGQHTDRSVDDLTSVFGPSPHRSKPVGSTQTYQLLPGTGNPAVGITCADASGRRVLTDQRGKPRPGPGKDRCDSGAYETP